MFKKIAKIFSINSMSRRMRVAFTSIILLLIFSGAMSLFELERVGHDTEKILDASRENIELAEQMITALNKQNNAIIHMAVMRNNSPLYINECKSSINELDQSINIACERIAKSSKESADMLRSSSNCVNTLAREYAIGQVHAELRAMREIDSTTTYNTHNWYIDQYNDEYMDLAQRITNFMADSQDLLGNDVNQLSHTAQRAVTPVFISLVVMLVVVLMFYYFMRIYLIKPILRMNRSLGNFITYKMPFDNTIKCRDELETMRERIKTITEKQQL